jgi:hypothetical protein
MQKFTATTTAPVSAVLAIPAGRIRLVAADRADTVVEVLPADASKGRDVKAAEQIAVEYTDGVLRIAAPEARNQLFGPSGAVEVTVQLPAGSSVEAKSAGAGFEGVGRFGDVVVDGAHGPVTFDEVAGARLTVLAGDVTVGRLGGDAEISTQKGDLTITEAVRGTVTLNTGHGDITIGAASGTAATLDAGISQGRIDNTLKNGEGAADRLAIRATSGYGDITARGL